MNISIKERGCKLPGPDIMIVEARSKKLSMKVVSEDGSVKTLHSLYDPEVEAKKIVNAFGFGGKDLQLFEDNSFDFVYSYLVLQHIPRKFVHNYFKEIPRILDDKGLFVFQMPMRTEEEKPPESPDTDFRTVRFYSLEEVNLLCRSNNLTISKTSRCSEDSLWFTCRKIN